MPDGGGLDSAGLDDLLSKTRQAVEAVRGSRPTEGEPLVGKGTDAGERVHVTAASPGQITAIVIDPRLLRLPAQELSAQLIEAVNAALNDLRARSVDAVAPGDVSQLGMQLADLQNESIRQMERFRSAIQVAVGQIRARGQ